jgi:hypothetical protein
MWPGRPRLRLCKADSKTVALKQSACSYNPPAGKQKSRQDREHHCLQEGQHLITCAPTSATYLRWEDLLPIWILQTTLANPAQARVLCPI